MTPASGSPPSPQPGWLHRARHRLRLEDLLLFAWLLVAPILLPASTGSSRPEGPDPLGGVVDVVALVLAGACIGARSREGVRSGLAEGSEGIAYAVGPLFGALAFGFDEVNRKLALPDALASVPIALPVVALVLARLRLRPLSAPERRALVTPFLLVTSSYFTGIVAGLGDAFDIGRFGPATAFVLAIGALGTLVFYVMFVYAPRQIAEREGSPATWALRFGVFILGLVVSATLGSTLRA